MLTASEIKHPKFIALAKRLFPCATMKCRICGDRWPFAWACSKCGLCPDDCCCEGRTK